MIVCLMRNRSKGRALLTGLLSDISGCSLIEKPDEIRAGIVVRQVSGRNLIFGDEKKIGYYRIQVYKRVDERFDYFLGGDFTKGELDLSPTYTDGSVIGYMGSFRGGLSCYPFESRKFSLDFGAEIFKADFKLTGNLGKMEIKFKDSFIGGGLSLGASYVIPINKNIGIYFTGGYNFAENESKHGSYDLSGPYGSMGISIPLKN